MNVTDYLFSAVFIALIFRQVRGRRLTAKGLLLPVVIVAVAADRYLHGFPSGGNNLLLVGVCAGTGLVLMALTEVVGRYGLLALRGLAVRGSGGPPAAEQARRRRAARAGTIGG